MWLRTWRLSQGSGWVWIRNHLQLTFGSFQLKSKRCWMNFMFVSLWPMGSVFQKEKIFKGYNTTNFGNRGFPEQDWLPGFFVRCRIQVLDRFGSIFCFYIHFWSVAHLEDVAPFDVCHPQFPPKKHGNL